MNRLEQPQRYEEHAHWRVVRSHYRRGRRREGSAAGELDHRDLQQSPCCHVPVCQGDPKKGTLLEDLWSGLTEDMPTGSKNGVPKSPCICVRSSGTDGGTASRQCSSFNSTGLGSGKLHAIRLPCNHSRGTRTAQS